MSVNQKVRGPYDYTAKLPCKSLRSRLIDIFNEWIRANEHNTIIIKYVIETLHNASLMYRTCITLQYIYLIYRIDDIQDYSQLRRNQKCAYTVFGIPLTINSANLAYFEALKHLETLDNYSSEIIKCYTGKDIDIKSK